MFIDPKILNIIRRAGGIQLFSESEIFINYTQIIIETISKTVMEYLEENNKIEKLSSDNIRPFISQITNNINKEPELLKRIYIETNKINMDLIDEFFMIAPKGDILYLKVYLKSQQSHPSNSINTLEDLAK